MKKKIKEVMPVKMYYGKILDYFDIAQHKITKESAYYGSLFEQTDNEFVKQTASYIYNQLSKIYKYTLDIASLIEDLAQGRKIRENVNFMISSVIDDLVRIEDYCAGCQDVVLNEFIRTVMGNTHEEIKSCTHIMLTLEGYAGFKLIKIIESEYSVKK